MAGGQEAEVLVGTYEDYVIGYRIESIPIKRNSDGPKKKKQRTEDGGREDGEDGTHEITLEQTFAVRGHSGSVRSLAASRDGSFLFSAGYDEMTNLFSLKRRKLLQTTEGAVNCSTFVENSHLICGSEDSNVYFYERRGSSMSRVKTLRGHKAAVTCLDVHPSGKILLTFSKDQTMRTWNLIKGRCAYVTRMKTQAHLIKWSPSGEEFIIAANNEIYLYNNSGNLKESIKLEKRINSIEFLTDNIFVVAVDSGRLEFFDLKAVGCPLLRKFEAHEARIKSVSCLSVAGGQPGSLRLVTAASSGSIKLWSVSVQNNAIDEPRELSSVDLDARLTCLAVAVRKPPAAR